MAHTMRALRKTDCRAGAELQEIPVPEPGEGEVLVRVHAASICGTDLHIYDWNEWAAARIPRVPMTFGHEVAGYVELVGPEVHHLKPGAFVAAETHIACGHCSTCQSGRAHICENLRIMGVDTEGAFAEFVVLPARNAWIVGEGIHPDVASIMEPFGNGVHAAFGTGGGEDLATNAVAVIGCGPIGLFSVGIARALGAWKVIAIEPTDERRRLAAEMGADLLVNPTEDDPVAVVHEATNGSGAEVVLEMSGNARAIDQGTRMLARGGRMSLLGLPDSSVTLDLNDQVIFKEARLQGITGREMFRTWQQTTTLLSTGRVDVTPVITHRFPLARFEEAFAITASGRSGKVILFPGE
ncbi:MAG TPA: L-threonine 3-dehydrogenase [Actinomycetota bacterium]|jgi:threonine 3-dehydrogenase|nr:L-threonine 3-dehydrogenase [Actinomycetota bacterium]